MKVIGIGAGGHAKVMIDIINKAGEHEIIGLFDTDAAKHGSDVSGVPVLGDDSLLDHREAHGIEAAFVAVGPRAGDPIRQQICARLSSINLPVIDVVHPTAIIAGDVIRGCGLTMMAGAIINPGTTLGEHVTINTSAVVEHDCELADHVHIAPGARLGGGVRIGASSMVGLGAIVLPGMQIGVGATVGAGAVVVSDVTDGAIVKGVPAR